MGFLLDAFAEPFDLALLALERLFVRRRRQVAGRFRALGAGRGIFGFGRQRLAGIAEARAS
jgi:hypothetical protein